ncbi:MAG TPA: TonB family protein [Blastocatellia bacterium]|nr:TonB family protein [Blastocatellia bacterium]
MLETIKSYIDADSGFGEGFVAPERVGGRLDRRFPSIVILSISGHVLLGAGLLVLSWWGSKHQPTQRRPGGSEYSIQMLRVAPPDDSRFQLRAAPEPPDRADVNHLAFSPESSDTNLVSRSPNPGAGTEGVPRPGSTEGRANRPSSSVDQGSKVVPPPANDQPPSLSSVAIGQALQPPRPVAPGLKVSESTPAPAPPSPSTPAGAKKGQGESSGRSSELGFRDVESQYRAYVRSRIYKANQRIMPQEWIETTLAGKAATDFSIVIDRNGRLVSVRMLKSSGYRALDEVARQAIELASPFQAFPAEIADALEFPVTVSYAPYRTP